MSDNSGSGLSGRQMCAAGTTGLLTASAGVRGAAQDAGQAPAQGPAQPRAGLRTRRGADGTPGQVHLTWDGDPRRTVVVSWSSSGQAVRPRVRIGRRVICAAERSHTDPLSGTLTWTYHARVDGLRPGATYGYAVTADNDRNAADPFSATFTTAPDGRTPFRFTSFGDLGGHDAAGTPSAAGTHSTAGAGQSAYAVAAVETFQPLFHLLNTDLADVQASAAYRPWLPVPGSHGVSLEQSSFLSRYTLPTNSVAGLDGRSYAFRVGTVAFVCLSGDDSGGAQAQGLQRQWLESTLATARANASIDWIIASVHQSTCSSAREGGGTRPEWLSLCDTYEVDLVMSGHDHRYERSFPVPGSDTVFDTSQGSVHLLLGSAGAPEPAVAEPLVRVAACSARRAPSGAHGIAVFDVNPGHEAGGQTSITARYYHAADPDDYAHLETFTLIRPRSDRRRWHPKA